MKITGKQTRHLEVEVTPRELLETLEAEITRKLNELYIRVKEEPRHPDFHRFTSFYVKRSSTEAHVIGYCIEGRHPREIEWNQVLNHSTESVVKILDGLEEIKAMLVL